MSGCNCSFCKRHKEYMALKEKLSKGEVFNTEDLMWFKDLYEACVDAEEKRDWYRYKLEKKE